MHSSHNAYYALLVEAFASNRSLTYVFAIHSPTTPPLCLNSQIGSSRELLHIIVFCETLHYIIS